MNLQTFQAMLDWAGSDPGNWPSEARHAAEALLAREAAARGALRAAQRLELLLSDALDEADSAAEQHLIACTLHAIDTEPPRAFGRLIAWLWPENRAGRWARTVLACLVPLAAGFALGVTSGDDAGTDLVQLSQSAFVATATELTAP